MKFSEYLKEEKEVNLIGKRIGWKIVTPEIHDEKWKGDFLCSNIKLTSLKGAPKKIDGDFYCDNNHLITLKDGPEIVDGVFDCSMNNLTSLEGAPRSVGSAVFCGNNELTSLKGAPIHVGGNFNCGGNNLTSLVGAPEITDGFFCSSNKLTSLEGAPRVINHNGFGCSKNTDLKNLHDIHKMIMKINGKFFCQDNKIQSHVLGLLLITGINEIVGNEQWIAILNKYLNRGRKGLIACQNELIDTGLEEYAQL